MLDNEQIVTDLENGEIIIKPAIRENGEVWCQADCPQFGYSEENGTCQCCRLTENSDIVCYPYFKKRIEELEAEVKRLNSLLAANRLLTRAAIHNMFLSSDPGAQIAKIIEAEDGEEPND